MFFICSGRVEKRTHAVKLSPDVQRLPLYYNILMTYNNYYNNNRFVHHCNTQYCTRRHIIDFYYILLSVAALILRTYMTCLGKPTIISVREKKGSTARTAVGARPIFFLYVIHIIEVYCSSNMI